MVTPFSPPSLSGRRRLPLFRKEAPGIVIIDFPQHRGRQRQPLIERLILLVKGALIKQWIGTLRNR